MRHVSHVLLSLQVMAQNCKIYALKRIRLQGRDAEAASGFIDEITLLQRLRNKPNIIQLIDSQVRRLYRSSNQSLVPSTASS